ncbi:hypothetical protein [Microcoleus sp. D3_18a_C4]|uniref:hypothetical protein n=1 Tax=Microcoleus sp. D3_18a_C4 TaxID=3055332 RepID=UPI002FD51F35
MSILTQTLEKIVNWLQVNDPESISGLRPGLTDPEIEKLTHALPLALPWEVSEIYRYCNGMIALTPSLVLESLEAAIENTRYADWMRGNTIPNSSPIMPLFHGDGKDFYYVICDRENDSPVWCLFVGEKPRMYAASLTSLILTTWECYEMGAYYIYFYREYGYSYIEEDLEKFEEIFQNYNPDQMDTWRYIWKL